MLCEAKCVFCVPAMVGMHDGYRSLMGSLSGRKSGQDLSKMLDINWHRSWLN